MEDKVRIPEEQLHDLKQNIYAWIIANGYASNKEEAEEVAKFNNLITAKVKVIIKTVNKEIEVPPKDYDESKAKANKYNSLKGLMKDLLK